MGDAGPDGWAGWGRGKMTRLGSQALGSWGYGGAGSTSKRVGPLSAGMPHPSRLSWALLFDVWWGRGAKPAGLALPAPGVHWVPSAARSAQRPWQGVGLRVGLA